MDLADHFRAIGANWWRILVISLVLGALTFAYSATRDDEYRATTLVSVAPQEMVTNQNISQDVLNFRVQAYGQQVKFPATADIAVADGKLTKKYHLSATAATGHVTVILNGVAGLLGVVATGGSRKEAQDVSAAFSNALVTNAGSQTGAQLRTLQLYQARLQLVLPTIKDPQARQEAQQQYDELTVKIAQLSGGGSVAQVVSIVGPASLDNNGEPVSPTPARDALFVFLAAIVVSAEGFVIRRALSDRFARTSDVDTITQLTGLPVLALVPRSRGPEVVEAFRTLRTNLMFLEGAGRPRTIAVVSPNPGAGKSFCAVHLAESAVAVDAAVVLVDADLRRPVLHQRLRVDREPGLSDALGGGAIATSLHDVDGYPNLSLMPSGSPVTDTVAILGGRGLRGVLDALPGAELVIVDTPPGSAYADALAVSAQCDAALLILDADTTRRRAAKQFIEALDRTGASLIGVVLNGAAVSRRDGYERG